MGPKHSWGSVSFWMALLGAQPSVPRSPGVSSSPCHSRAGGRLLLAHQLGLGGVQAHPAAVPATGCSCYCQGFSRQYNTNQRDLNVRQAWEQGYTGKGIVVSILDDGIEKNHPDLEGNYVSVGQCRRAMCHGTLSGQLSPFGAAPGVRGTRLCLLWRDMEESGGGGTGACPPARPSLGAMEYRHCPVAVGLAGCGGWSLTARSVFQDPGASFDVNDQDPDPQPRYTQMNDNR